MTKTKKYQFHSSAHRGNYTYDLVGTLKSQKLKRNSQYAQHYYQLQITCENLPQITKIFVFQPKLTNSQIWKELETTPQFNARYHFLCRNYQGYYYLIDWKLLSSQETKGYENSK